MKRGILVAICLLISIPCIADRREEPMNVLFALDTSISMRQSIAIAKQALEQEYIPLLIPGDRVCLFRFDEKPKIAFEGEVASSGNGALLSAIRRLEATGPFTDIGAALDAMYEKGTSMMANGLRLYALLITDERQEAPIGSKYADPSSVASHQLLRFVLKEEREAFSIITLGIGYGDTISDESSQIASQSESPAKPRQLFVESLKANASASGEKGASTTSGVTPQDASITVSMEGTASDQPWASDPHEVSSPFDGSTYIIVGSAIVVTGLVVFFVMKALRARKGKDDDEGGKRGSSPAA